MLQPLRVPTGLPDSSAPSSAPGRANQCERAQLPATHARTLPSTSCAAARPTEQQQAAEAAQAQGSSPNQRRRQRRQHRTTPPWQRSTTCPTACSALCWLLWAGAGGAGLAALLLDVLKAGLFRGAAAPAASNTAAAPSAGPPPRCWSASAGTACSCRSPQCGGSSPSTAL